MTIEELKAAFVYAYQQKSDAVYFVPGKINITGEHIAEIGDIHLQPTLSVGIYLLLRRNHDNCIRFWSLNEPEAINWKIDQSIPKHINSWIKYPLDVINEFLNDGYSMDGGYDTLFWGNIPKEAAFSSTEGLELKQPSL